MRHHSWNRSSACITRKINPPTSNYCFSCGQHLSEVVIDTDEGIQQSVLRDNPDILRQLIDEKIAEVERRGEFFCSPFFLQSSHVVQQVHCGILQFLWAASYQHDSADNRQNSQKFPFPYTNLNKNVNFGVPDREIMRGN
jgi:hypothetical protein